jgi:hypothetical protein
MDSRETVAEFLRHANGQPFCDGCIALELQLQLLEVRAALDHDTSGVDRGHGRCSVCGRTLTVTRVLAA